MFEIFSVSIVKLLLFLYCNLIYIEINKYKIYTHFFIQMKK